MPMRTTWNGSISFGLVNILVGLAPALQASRAPLIDVLKDSARGSSGTKRSARHSLCHTSH